MSIAHDTRQSQGMLELGSGARRDVMHVLARDLTSEVTSRYSQWHSHLLTRSPELMRRVVELEACVHVTLRLGA